MIGIVVAGHGDLAESLIRTAHSVVESGTPMVAVSIDPNDTPGTFEPKLRQAIDKVRSEAGVLVLTDMFGGTPANVGLAVHDPGRVEVLTGVNLPMVIKALPLSGRSRDLATIAWQIKAAGQRSIVIATEVLRAPATEPSEGVAAASILR